MDGIQKTVALGLRNLARKVEEGAYGQGDEAFDEEGNYGGTAQAFLDDMHDEVLDKME